MHKLILTTLLLSTSVFATTFDKTEELDGVSLKSGKEESTRTYLGTIEKTYPYSLELMKKAITGFEDRCNNDFKSKRKFVSEEVDCKHHNDHVIETFLVKDVNKVPGFEEFSEYYLLGRRVYNRSAYGFYDLVTVKESVNDKNQKVITVSTRMLNDDEVTKFTTPKFEKDTVFDTTTGVFTLTSISPTETHFSYEYKTETTHWLLNKEIAVPQVFASIGKTMNQLFKTVEMESQVQKRDVASK